MPTSAAKDLSVTQLLVPSTAAQRADRMVMPLPSPLRARRASQQRLLASLLKLALVEEVPTQTLTLSWRQNDQGQHHALQLAAAGVAAVPDAVIETPPPPAFEEASRQTAGIPHAETAPMIETTAPPEMSPNIPPANWIMFRRQWAGRADPSSTNWSR